MKIDLEKLTEMIEVGMTTREIAPHFNVSSATISDWNIKYKIFDNLPPLVNLNNYKKIKDFPNYWVNSKGVVYNKAKRRILTPVRGQDGYQRVSFSGGGKIKAKRIHRLIAEYFIPNPNNLPLVRHLNDNKDDNRIENLAWGTSKQNSEDRFKNGNWPKGKVTASVAKEVYQSKLSEKELCEKFNLKRDDIRNIKNRVYYKRYTDGLTLGKNEPKKRKLTKDQVVEIFTTPKYTVDFHIKYNISLSTIHRIRARLSYKEFTKDL